MFLDATSTTTRTVTTNDAFKIKNASLIKNNNYGVKKNNKQKDYHTIATVSTTNFSTTSAGNDDDALFNSHANNQNSNTIECIHSFTHTEVYE